MASIFRARTANTKASSWDGAAQCRRQHRRREQRTEPQHVPHAHHGPIRASARHIFRGVARVSDEPVEAASGALGVSQVLTLGDGPTLMTRGAGRRGRWRSSSSPDDGATFVHADAIVRCRRRCRARGGFRRAQRARSSANGLAHPAASTRAGVGAERRRVPRGTVARSKPESVGWRLRQWRRAAREVVPRRQRSC